MECILWPCSGICEAGRASMPGRPGVCRQPLGREAVCWGELDWRGNQKSAQTEKAGWWVTLRASLEVVLGIWIGFVTWNHEKEEN